MNNFTDSKRHVLHTNIKYINSSLPLYTLFSKRGHYELVDSIANRRLYLILKVNKYCEYVIGH